jgi:WD40 repeat protein
VDTRNLKTKNANWVIWQIQHAHQGSIRDIQYHPLVPYWVASAGNDGYIKLWDLRYNGKEPLVSISAHDRIIRKIAWSKTHSELLVSGGIDHKVKIWSIRSDPHYLLEIDDKTHSDIVVGVDFSKNGKIHCHSLSSSGEFGTCVFTSQFLEPLVVSRFHEKDVDEMFVEKKIFTREFPVAFEKM